MKLLVALCVLTFVALSSAKPQNSRGCIYILGKCERECEEGTHGYITDCVSITAEPTCAEPNPKAIKGYICSYSACYCDAPTVRDLASGKCVTIDKCPK